MVARFDTDFQLHIGQSLVRLRRLRNTFRSTKREMERPINVRTNVVGGGARPGGVASARSAGAALNPFAPGGQTFAPFRNNVAGVSQSLRSVTRSSRGATAALGGTTDEAMALGNAFTTLESRMRAFLVVFAIGAVGGGAVSFISRTIDEVTDLENRLRWLQTALEILGMPCLIFPVIQEPLLTLRELLLHELH